MIQDFKSDTEQFRGQRWLTTLLLLAFAAAMVVVGIKGLVSGDFTTAARPNQAAGFIPARLVLPGQNFEVALAEVSSETTGQPAGPGWLKTSAKPGEAGTAVIAIKPDWPVANLQPGDRLEITGQSGQKLAYEITAANVTLASAGQNATNELKLVVVGPGGRESRVIIARPVATN